MYVLNNSFNFLRTNVFLIGYLCFVTKKHFARIFIVLNIWNSAACSINCNRDLDQYKTKERPIRNSIFRACGVGSLKITNKRLFLAHVIYATTTSCTLNIPKHFARAIIPPTHSWGLSAWLRQSVLIATMDVTSAGAVLGLLTTDIVLGDKNANIEERIEPIYKPKTTHNLFAQLKSCYLYSYVG